MFPESPTLGDLAIFAMTSYTHPKYGPTEGWSQIVPGWAERFPKMCAIRDKFRALPQVESYFERWGRFHAQA